MALPPQRLLNDDLFIINRITANDVETYKINTDDIGIFLLETPQIGGGSQDNKYVNDGEINIYGKLQNTGSSYLNLHSANEYCEGKLSFDEGFYITGSHMDVLITHDYATLAKELSCDDGGIDGSTTCLKLDMEWLSENIVCSGLEATGNCIGIDLCDEISGLTFGNDGCLHINLCPDKGIIYHPNNGCLELDLTYLTNSLTCDGLRPSGGNINSECMEIDMEWLTDNIRCGSAGNPTADGGSGLIDGGGCLEVDPCWVNNQLNASNPQYLITDEDATSIDTMNCKIRVNEEWLLQWSKDNINNIEIKDDALCLEIGISKDTHDINKNLFEGEVVINLPEACMDDWTVGIIQREIQDIYGGDGIDVVGNPNVAQGVVVLEVNDDYIFGLIEEKVEDIIGGAGIDVVGNPNVALGTVTLNANLGNINVSGSSCLKISSNKNVVNGAVTITLDESCLIALIDGNSGGGGTNPPPGGDTGGCVNGGILLDVDNDCLYLDNSDKGCTKQSFISCAGVNVRTSNGINFNIDKGPVAGLNLNPNNKSLRLAYDLKIDGSGDCANWKDGINVIRLSLGGDDEDGSTGRLFRTECLSTKDSTADKDSDEGHVYATPVSRGRHNLAIDRTKRSAYPDYITEDDKINYQARQANPELYKEENPYQNFYDAAPPNTEDITDSVTLTDISNFDSNIDSIVDTLGESKESGGLFRWVRLKDSETKKLNLFFDPTELAAISPVLSKGRYSLGSYQGRHVPEDEENLWLEGGLKPIDQRSIYYYQTDQEALSVLSFVAHKKAKQRISQLEASVTRASMLQTLGINEYNNETAAANSGLGQGEVYWDLTLNRMRAVT